MGADMGGPSLSYHANREEDRSLFRGSERCRDF